MKGTTERTVHRHERPTILGILTQMPLRRRLKYGCSPGTGSTVGVLNGELFLKRPATNSEILGRPGRSSMFTRGIIMEVRVVLIVGWSLLALPLGINAAEPAASESLTPPPAHFTEPAAGYEEYVATDAGQSCGTDQAGACNTCNQCSNCWIGTCCQDGCECCDDHVSCLKTWLGWHPSCGETTGDLIPHFAYLRSTTATTTFVRTTTRRRCNSGTILA